MARNKAVYQTRHEHRDSRAGYGGVSDGHRQIERDKQSAAAARRPFIL
jgi:hypothetical protein